MTKGTAIVTNVEAHAVQRRPEIGRRIREARLKKGWTQARTAQYLGCSRRRVNRVERGITDFSVFELELLAQVFDVPVAFFLEC
jgi:transcriptional regulator with XRE-family HTH domain